MHRRKFIQGASVGATALGFATALSGGLAAPAVVRSSSLKGIKINSHTAYGPPQWHPTNNYWIETPDGVFVVDGQWVLSEAQVALQKIRQQTDKPIVGMLITHDHTDHYGGMEVFTNAEPDRVPVYATALTGLSIKNDPFGWQKMMKNAYGEEVPDTYQAPEHRIKDGDKLSVGSNDFEFLERTDNEAPSTAMLCMEDNRVLFSGDIVYDRYYAIFAEGMSGLFNWRSQLQRLKEEFNDYTVYPGHGEPRKGDEIIQTQIDFLTAFEEAVLAPIEKKGAITAQDRGIIQRQITEKFPDHRPVINLNIEQMINRSIDWLAEEVSQAKIN